MSTIHGILSIGAGALRAQQLGINVTANNIANVNTPGYSRQRVNFTDNSPTDTVIGQFGTGVRTVSVERSYDAFLFSSVIDEQQQFHRYSGQREALSLVEATFTDTETTGLSAALSQFWNGWQDLSNNPSGHAERTAVISNAETLTMTIKNMDQRLDDLTAGLNNDIDGAVPEINRLAEQLATLNKYLRQAGESNEPAPDLFDMRDRLLSEMSEHIDFTVNTTGGGLTLTVGNGVTFIDGETVNPLSFDGTDISLDPGGGPQVITGDITGGRIAGRLWTRDTAISDYRQRLDTLASELISQVNGIHTAGQGLDGSQNAFFTGAGAADISLNPALSSNPDKIAAASLTEGLPGGNQTALALADLGTTPGLSGGTQTFGGFYANLVQDVGMALQHTDTFVDYHTAVLQQVENQRQEISGVSLDEEMVNLIQYQLGYEASARIITTADEMIQTLLNIV